MQLVLNLDGSGGTLDVFNDQGIWDSFFLTGNANVTVDIFMAYGDGSWGASDVDQLPQFALGSMAYTAGNDTWVLQLLDATNDKQVPDFLINEANGFNHLPQKGARIRTTDGIIILQ